MTAGLRVIAPGPLSTVQDLGRPGFQRFGVSVSGAADRYALRLGSLLTGNDQRAAAVEVTVGGAEFEFTGPCAFAVTGGDLGPALNGVPLPIWETAAAKPGDRLTMAGPRSGIRAYVNISGGVDTPPVMGSRSTHVAARLGGVDGRALQPGDLLPAGPVTNAVRPGRKIPSHLLPRYGGEVTARVIPGPQDDRFDPDATAVFYGSVFMVSDRSDRMGCRLTGPAVPAIGGVHDIVSDGVVTGAVQVPGDAQPIILLADRQTTGGYAKIGVVAGVDLASVAQARPGAAVRFERIAVEDAQRLAKTRMAALRSLSFERPSAQTPVARTYSMRIGGIDYEVEVTASSPGGSYTARVNGVEYPLSVDSGE